MQLEKKVYWFNNIGKVDNFVRLVNLFHVV